jgi:glycosyltransferase involved in cell wall biosynthesis
VRILLVSDDPAEGKAGAVKATHKLAGALTALGHHCDVLFSEELGPWPRRSRPRDLLGPLLAYRAAWRQWRAAGPYDVIDASGAEGWLIAGMRRCGRFPGAAVITRSHGLEHIAYQELLADHASGMACKPWWRRWWYPLARLSQIALGIRLADRVILLNRRGRDLVLRHRWQPGGRIDLNPHGVDAARWRSAPRPDGPRGGGALFVGAWYSAKGVDYLADAHGQLVRAGVLVPLTVLGGAPGHPDAVSERHVRSSFAPESQPWLTVLPWQDDEDAVFALYRHHDFLVCPSTAEGFGIVVIEALSQRLPVLCTSSVGAAERLRSGVDALIVPPRNATALAGAMARLWRDPALRSALGEAGHERSRDWSWRGAAEATLATYAAARVTAAGAK